MKCISKASLSAEQNSVRCWSVILIIACLPGALVGFMLQLYVSGAVASLGVVAAFTVLCSGPKEKEQGALTYKMLLGVVAAALITHGVGIYLGVVYFQTMQGLLMTSLQYCCTDPTFATCDIAAGQVPCQPVIDIFTNLFYMLYGAFADMGFQILVLIVLAFKSHKALKSLPAVEGTGGSKMEV